MEMKKNDFIAELQDLTYLNWTDTKMSPGTPGCFLKAFEENEGVKYYYKLSNYDSYRGVFGHENINELIISRFLTILGVEHLGYQLIHALVLINGKTIETYITKSVNFRKKEERKIAFDVYYDLNKQKNEEPLAFAIRMGWEMYFYRMMVIDYLICNRDRHGANIEILVDQNEKARPAPIFDNGCSLLFSCYGNLKSIEKFDVMEDRAVNNFIGSRSLEYNLQLIPKRKKLFKGYLKESDKDVLLEGVESILPFQHTEKIWNMLWKRWKYFAQICN